MRKPLLISILTAIMFTACASTQKAAEKSWININNEKNEPVALIDNELKEIRYYSDKEEVIRTLVKILLQVTQKPEEPKVPSHVETKKQAAQARKIERAKNGAIEGK